MNYMKADGEKHKGKSHVVHENVIEINEQEACIPVKPSIKGSVK